MHLLIDGIARGDLETLIAVIALDGRCDADVGGEMSGWLPTGVPGPVSITPDRTDAGWPIVSSLLEIADVDAPFAWGAELVAPDDRPLPEQVALWMTVIDAGARVLITRHVAEAKRVAVMASDLLELAAARGGG